MKEELAYSVSWGSPEVRATAKFRPYDTNAEARTARDARAKMLTKVGIKIKKRTHTNQLRQYWGWQMPCNIICNVYIIEILD